MKTRVISAAVLLPLLILILFAAPKVLTAVLFAAASAVAAYELLFGTGFVRRPFPLLVTAVTAALVSLNSYFQVSNIWVKLGVLLFWVLLFAEMMRCNMSLLFSDAAVCFAAGLLIPYLLTGLVRIHNTEFGRWFVVVPFVLAFMSDTGAYFTGRAFGKHKLAPSISPKKTIEGVVGGVIGAMIGMLAFTFILQIFFDFRVNYLYALIYGAVGSGAAVFGDLCFSVIKRQTGIKDYGKLIPGHGGILDRFDSMIVVAPLSEILLIILPLAVKP